MKVELPSPVRKRGLPRRRRFGLGLLAAALLGAGGRAQAEPQPENMVKLEPYRKGFALRASVHGAPGVFTFDTGGGITVLAPKFAEKVGCKPWGRLSGYRMMGERLDSPRCDEVPVRVGKATYRAAVTAVIDVAPLFAKDAEPVDGSIALDLFAGKVITIDFPARQLVVESPQTLPARIARAKSLPVTLARELQGRALAAELGVPTPAGLVWFELDSGNGGTLLVSKPYAHLFGLNPAQKGPERADFAVGGGFHARGDAFTPDMILDGNLDMPFLRDKVITLDLAQGRLWLAGPA